MQVGRFTFRRLDQIVGYIIRCRAGYKYSFNVQGILIKEKTNEKGGLSYSDVYEMLITSPSKTDVVTLDAIKKACTVIEPGTTYEQFTKVFIEAVKFREENGTLMGFEDRHLPDWQKIIRGARVAISRFPENQNKNTFDRVDVFFTFWKRGIDIRKTVWEYRKYYINICKNTIAQNTAYQKYQIPVQFLKCKNIIPINEVDYKFVFELKELDSYEE